jgi:hypothetical protein
LSVFFRLTKLLSVVFVLLFCCLSFFRLVILLSIVFLWPFYCLSFSFDHFCVCRFHLAILLSVHFRFVILLSVFFV